MRTMVDAVSSAPIIRQLSAREPPRNSESNAILTRKISEGAIERKTTNGSIITVDSSTEIANENVKRKEKLLNSLKKEARI
ncbi:unnamed protein product [Anisakis simplex]|uniref:Uncharacterized protein n=1 Tax=Anisakis simplex TaxID=6269 RepID=A0A0M3K855_ANISI|nr:unnamed protein product [Anisakis simplex]